MKNVSTNVSGIFFAFLLIVSQLLVDEEVNKNDQKLKSENCEKRKSCSNFKIWRKEILTPHMDYEQAWAKETLLGVSFSRVEYEYKNVLI